MSEKPDEHSETEDPSEDKFEKVPDLFGYSNNQPWEEEKKWYQHQDFWIGFGSWFGVNGLVWWLIVGSGFELTLVLWPALFLANIIALIYFAFKYRKIAFGLLSAFTVNFVVLLARGVYEQVICFSPFFIDLSDFFF